MHLLAHVVKLKHMHLETLTVVVEAVRPLIRMVRLAFPTDLKRLLEIRPFLLPLLGDVAEIHRIARFLAAGLAVPSIRLWRRPRESHLLRHRSTEERRGFLECFRQRRPRDGMVSEVDEACGLKAGEDGLRSRFAGGFVAGEEFVEVDQWDFEAVGTDRVTRV